jgi:CRP-like cAMP-binding protein
MPNGEYLDGPRGQLLRRVEKALGIWATLEAQHDLVSSAEILEPYDERITTGAESKKSLRFIVNGYVKLSCRVDGTPQPIVELLGPGDFIYLPAGLARSPLHRFDIVAHERPLLVADMPRAVWSNVLEKLPAAHRIRFEQWASRTAWCRNLNRWPLLLLRTRPRVLRELILLARRFGEPHSDGWTRIAPRLSREDIAEVVLRSKWSVSRALGVLRRRKIVHREGHHLFVSTAALGEAGSRPG